MPDGLFFFACASMVASHGLPLLPGVREAAIARLGRSVYGALHGVVSTAALALLVYAYRVQEGGAQWFGPWPWMTALPVGLMPVAFILVVWGVLRRVRAPAAYGILLWAGLHLLATGNGVRVVLFATMALIGLSSLARGWRFPAGCDRLAPAVVLGAGLYGVMLLWLHGWLFSVVPLTLLP